MIKAIIARVNKFQYEKYAVFIALAVLFVISAIVSPYFTHIQNLLNILRQVSYIGIIALGMTFVMIGGGIDLSVGSLVAFIGAVGILALNYLMAILHNEYLAISGAILAALIMGILSGDLKWLSDHPRKNRAFHCHPRYYGNLSFFVTLYGECG